MSKRKSRSDHYSRQRDKSPKIRYLYEFEPLRKTTLSPVGPVYFGKLETRVEDIIVRKSTITFKNITQVKYNHRDVNFEYQTFSMPICEANGIKLCLTDDPNIHSSVMFISVKKLMTRTIRTLFGIKITKLSDLELTDYITFRFNVVGPKISFKKLFKEYLAESKIQLIKHSEASDLYCKVLLNSIARIIKANRDPKPQVLNANAAGISTFPLGAANNVTALRELRPTAAVAPLPNHNTINRNAATSAMPPSAAAPAVNGLFTEALALADSELIPADLDGSVYFGNIEANAKDVVWDTERIRFLTLAPVEKAHLDKPNVKVNIGIPFCDIQSIHLCLNADSEDATNNVSTLPAIIFIQVRSNSSTRISSQFQAEKTNGRLQFQPDSVLEELKYITFKFKNKSPSITNRLFQSNLSYNTMKFEDADLLFNQIQAESARTISHQLPMAIDILPQTTSSPTIS